MTNRPGSRSLSGRPLCSPAAGWIPQCPCLLQETKENASVLQETPFAAPDSKHRGPNKPRKMHQHKQSHNNVISTVSTVDSFEKDRENPHLREQKIHCPWRGHRCYCEGCWQLRQTSQSPRNSQRSQSAWSPRPGWPPWCLQLWRWTPRSSGSRCWSPPRRWAALQPSAGWWL